jgi:carboxypeptidase C (cathepsin A)
MMEDSKSTVINPWSWNDKVNMLYIDQPTQVGFSYNNLVNGTLDEIPTPFLYKPQDFTAAGVPATNLTFLTGTFAAPNLAAAPNTTVAAAPAMWDFMQTWMQEWVAQYVLFSFSPSDAETNMLGSFPEYRANGDKFSIWSESYGGHYAPVFANFFEKQNDRIIAGTIPAPAIQLHIDTVGLVNACIDIDSQIASYPEFAFNNTYGIEAINETQYASAISSTAMCLNLTGICRSMADEQDPEGLGNNAEVNEACMSAYLFCFSKMHDGYDETV